MASPIGEASIKIQAETSPFDGALRKMTSDARASGDRAGDGFKGAFTRHLGGIAAAVGGAFAAIKVGGFLKDSIQQASSFGESLSKANVVFGQSAPMIEAWSKTAATSLGQSQQQALEAAGTFGNLFTALKIGQAPAAEMSTKLVGLAGDLASFNNVSPEDALLALRSGLTGETEPLKKFGVNMNEATLKAKALELGLNVGKGTLDANVKAQAAYALILEQTGTAQGDFARTSGGLANQQRILSARFKDMKKDLGEALLPITTKFVGFLSTTAIPIFGKLATAGTQAVDKLITWLGPKLRPVLDTAKLGLAGMVSAFQGEGVTSDGFVGAMERIGVKAREVVDWFQEHWPQIKEIVETKVIPALQTLYDKVKEVLGFMIDHQETIVAFGTAISLLATKNIMGDLVPALKAWRDAQRELSVLFGVSNFWMFIIIGAVALFVAGWIYAYKHVKWFHDAVDAYTKFLREKLLPVLKDVAIWIGEHVVAAIKAAWHWIQDSLIPALQGMWHWFQDNILPTLQVVAEWIGTHVVAAAEALWHWINDSLIPALQSFWSWINDSLIPALKDMWGWINDHIVPVFEAMVSALRDKIVPAITDAANWINDHLIPALKDLKTAYDEQVGPALDKMDDVLGKIRDALREIGTWINEHVIPAVQSLADLFSTALTPSGMSVGQVLGTLATIFAAVGAVILGSTVMAVFRLVELFFQLIAGGATLAATLETAVIGSIVAVAQWFQFLWDRGQPLRDFLGNVLAGAVHALGWAFDHVKGAIDDVIGGLQRIKDFDVGSLASKIPGAGIVSDIAGSIPFIGATGGIIPATAGGFPLVAGEAGSDEFLLTTDPTQRSRTVGLLSEFLHRTGYGRDLMMGLGGPVGPPLRPSAGGLQQVNNSRTWQSGAVQINIPAQGSPQATALAVSRRLAMGVAA